MLDFIINHWSIILWIGGVIVSYLLLLHHQNEATRCSLRNDILTIYDSCRPTKTITLYQKQAIHLSADLYDKLHGNSFVKAIVQEIDTYKVV